MPDERTSPSAGWREVYAAFDVDAGIEPPERPCPDCGRGSPRVSSEAYFCETHGYWRTGRDGGPDWAG